MEYSKYIVFRKKKSLKIDRPQKYGGNVEFKSYAELAGSFTEGSLHPTDLKLGVARALDEIISPIRTHFEKDPGARRLYDFVKSAESTR